MRNTQFLVLAASLFCGAALAGPVALPSKAQPPKAHLSAGLGGPFRDVPPGHWAAQSVETLRRAGIMRGYPPVKK